MPSPKSTDQMIAALSERAKELNCLYKIEETLAKTEVSLEELFTEVVAVIPPGWQYPDVCRARIKFGGAVYESGDFHGVLDVQSAPIIVQEKTEGSIDVGYTRSVPRADEGSYLKEERKLINTIAERLGHYILHQRLKVVFSEFQTMKVVLNEQRKPEWAIILEMLRRTDQNLYTRISRRMLNHLCWCGLPAADKLMHRFLVPSNENGENTGDYNRPRQREELLSFISTTDEIFSIAAENLSEAEILACIHKWMYDDKSGFLVDALENLDSSLAEIAHAISRYQHIAPEGMELSPSTEKGLRVSLIRRFFTEQLPFINIAKNYVAIGDFYELLTRIVFNQRSHGTLGGKSAGLFLATQIIRKTENVSPLLKDIKVPKTWYITSDGILNFIHYNTLEDIFSQKYLDIDRIREEYPHIVQVFKNSYFSPEIVNGLSAALDDFGDLPLIVRSSSLLEDGMNAAFSGKYKSLFLANQGTKDERLTALLDAIAEVYASTFSPDPIEYRAERGLLDFHEEMGIMIQEVVGNRVGKYFFPSFSGVAFSNNEIRWSARIKREDGLIRIVPGLGTRAVDRLSDDYPVLIAPGQPGLRVNVSTDETVRYSPKKIDVINLETNTFETVDVHELLVECGGDYPLIHRIVSLHEADHIRPPVGSDIDFRKQQTAVTFEGLISSTPFVRQINEMLKLLSSTLNTPVDIEFACDGKDLYLLQCRPQSFSPRSRPSPIPRDIPAERIVFTARRYISNGKIPDITHIVYVDPVRYSALSSQTDLFDVGRVIGKLNKLLPKRQFILMGPGRWGSRGDIRLGVNVTYSEINNTAALIEIAKKQGNYVPDVSFGTHFFQDLVESSIVYLPLYPDEANIIFHESFLTASRNILADVLPEYAAMSDVIHVIDLPAVTGGLVLRILMNAEQEEAIGFLGSPVEAREKATILHAGVGSGTEDHWTWRLRMAERIAAQIDAKRFGITAMYIFGSTKNATAGPGSDIDLIVRVADYGQNAEMLAWLNGWSLCLSEMNFLRTGNRIKDILDVHVVTDEDVRNKTSFASKIDAVTDAARRLQLTVDS